MTFWSQHAGQRSADPDHGASSSAQHVRVGNEDNLWDARNEALGRRSSRSRGGASIAEQFGRKVATAEEARKIMKIGVWYNSVEETLHNLGLPPNRPEGYTGFLAYDTNGRLPRVAGTKTHSASIL